MSNTTSHTTLNVHLTDAMQAQLGLPGVNAYAVFFTGDAGTDPSFHTLVDDGAVMSEGTVAIALPKPYVGGKIYFLIQSGTDDDLPSLIDQESEINFENAETRDFRYDSFEVTLQDTEFDAGNLTSVNGFGIPMEIAIPYDDGTIGTRGYGVTGSEMFGLLGDIGPDVIFDFSTGPFDTAPRAAISPSEAVGSDEDAFAASDWDAYIDTLKTSDLDLTITGLFNGAPDSNGVWHDAGFYAYTLEWDGDAGVFWLNPSPSSDIRGFIQLQPDQLANSIYSTLGAVGVYASKDDPEPYHILGETGAALPDGPYSMNSGANNQWGNVLTQLITGFTAGFYGTEGTSPNPDVTAPIDLDTNINWDPTYAFGRSLAGEPAPFQDPYSEVFFLNTNSYGSGYSDNLMRQYAEGGPLIDVSNSDGKNVEAIDITLFADDEPTSGYVEPVIHNYIEPGPDGYASPAGSNLVANNVKLFLAGPEVALSDEATLALDIKTGEDGTGAPAWTTVEFPADGGSRWIQWNLSWNGSGYEAVPMEDNAQGTGNLLITSLPVQENGVHWYRLRVGDGDAQKTFNLYAEVADGAFVNPKAGDPGALAIDGLAEIALPDDTEPTINTFTINFLYQSTNTLHPDVVSHLPADALPAAPPPPDAPVAGTLSGGTFTALPGQDAQTANAISTSAASVAFGWTGLNAAPGTSSWISGTTNKVGGENFAQVKFVGEGIAGLPPVVAQADIDGQWQTSAAALGNGSYTVTMTEYRFSDPELTVPIRPESDALSLDVALADRPLELTETGGLRLGGTGTSANWVDVDLLATRVEAGTVLALYRTTDEGHLIARDGRAGDDVPLADATVGSVGAYVDDAGTIVGTGRTTILLSDGEELRFALVRPDGSVVHPAVEGTADGGALDLEVGGFQLSAATDNELSEAETLAAGERRTGEPVVWLEEGAPVRIDLLGDADLPGRLALVPVERDAATGALSVGGVAFGSGTAFEAAVRAGLEGIAGGGVPTGAFAKSRTIEVSESGFFAPVLVLEDGSLRGAGAGDADGGTTRTLGDAVFAFEDGAEARDYNDLVVAFSLPDATAGRRLDGETEDAVAVGGAAVLGAENAFRSEADGPSGGIGLPSPALTVLPGVDGTARLFVAGEMHFIGGKAVLLRGDEGRIVVREDGSISHDGEPDPHAPLVRVRTPQDGVVIRNDGEIAGHVLLSAGDDRIGGTGTWSGGVSTGDGNDVFVHRGDTPVAGVRLQAGDDVFRADTSAAVEVTGNTGDDRLIGGSEDDVLFGGAGRDVLAGRGGDDALFGGSDGDVLGGGTGEDVLASRSGADRLRGEEGDDTLFGGAGADRLDGGPGEDVLVGGAGGDTFLFPTDPGVDRVEDFAPGVDRIALGASADDVSVEFTEEGALVRSGTSGLLLVGTFEDPLLG